MALELTDKVAVKKGSAWVAGGNTIDEIRALIFATIYPVGSIYSNESDATNPATLLGFGTWAAYGEGRVIVSFKTGDPSFGTIGATGGAQTVTLSTAQIPVHTHSVSDTGHVHSITDAGHGHANTFALVDPGHEHTIDDPGHTHTHNAVTDAGGAGALAVGGDFAAATINTASTGITEANLGSTGMSLTGGVSSNTTGVTVNNATTGITINNAGSGGSHENMPPYIVAYVWKRTA
jgi:microcystin-dependent protein